MKPAVKTEKYEMWLGDCMEVMPFLSPVNAIVTDPPYVMRFDHSRTIKRMGKYKGDLQTIGDEVPFDSWMPKTQALLCKANYFVFCSNKQISELMQWGESRDYLTTLLVWNKYNAPPFANASWRQDAEFCVHIRESGVTFNGNAQQKSKVIRLPNNQEQYGHPSQKPLEIVSRYVAICSNENETVLDPFAGSGTTGVACIKSNRYFIGIEKEEKYFDMALKRLEEAAAQGMLFAA